MNTVVHTEFFKKQNAHLELIKYSSFMNKFGNIKKNNEKGNKINIGTDGALCLLLIY